MQDHNTLGTGQDPETVDPKSSNSLGTGQSPDSLGEPAQGLGTGAPQGDPSTIEPDSERTQFPSSGDQTISAKQNVGDDQTKI